MQNMRIGNGSEQNPFRATDGTAGLQAELDALAPRGGVLQMVSGRYDIERSILLDTPSLCMTGGVWACNTDPNGAFETKYGTKLRMHGVDYPAISVGRHCSPLSGTSIRDLGVQGDIPGMDVRPLVDFHAPEKSAGLYFHSVRTDQCSFSRLAFCGLATAVAATGDAELDACTFENLNADGCGNGFWFSPRASYYTRVRSCVIADNPYYGFYLGGQGKHIHNLEICDSYFVRNGGAFTSQDPIAAAVFFDHASQCAVTNCIFDAPGVFWYYDDNATQNNERQPSGRKTPALYIIGNENRMRGNTFLNSSDDSIRIHGNGNILIDNIADGNVRICGENNVISTLVFTSPDARLILEGAAAQTTVLHGVEPWRIVRTNDSLIP